MKTYDDALKYLDSFCNYEKKGFDGLSEKIDLARIKDALKKLGEPDKAYKAVHIAGTKGKGSTSAFTSSILKEHGLKVGEYTSPHLVDFRERIKVGGRIIPEEDFLKALREVSPVLAGEFTYFEVLTLLAIFYFAKEKIDIAVFETGLGGRLDATNVLEADIYGISPISYDHMEVLGETLEEISREKAAIIKKGSKCISSPQKASALKVIKKKCTTRGVPLRLLGEDITWEIKEMHEEGTLLEVKTARNNYPELKITMPGEFQAENASMALGICEEILPLTGKEMDGDAVKRGLKEAFLPGRMEVVSKNPLIVLDGLQNSSSAERVKYSVEHIFKYDKLILLLGLSKNKDAKGVCRALGPLSERVILTRAQIERAMDPDVIRGYVTGGKAQVTRDSKEALGLALKEAGEKDMILVAGSFYLAGEVKKLLKN